MKFFEGTAYVLSTFYRIHTLTDGCLPYHCCLESRRATDISMFLQSSFMEICTYIEALTINIFKTVSEIMF